jgi:plastocyanin
MRRVAIALAAVALVVGAAGCGGDGDDASEEATTTGVASSDAERMEVKGEDFVEIAMHDEFFKSAILVGTPGQTLTINLKNEGAAAHTFTVDDQLVDEEVQPGGVGQVRVTFPETGEAPFICRYHESLGMVGTLETSS